VVRKVPMGRGGLKIKFRLKRLEEESSDISSPPSRAG
jgi:hypothetical protein